eukprot:97495-Pleurochrysis_carterae.AAC.1
MRGSAERTYPMCTRRTGARAASRARARAGQPSGRTPMHTPRRRVHGGPWTRQHGPAERAHAMCT